jgi:hypothetical protein
MKPETVATAAATAGSARQIRSQGSNPKTATVEDCDEDKDEQNVNPLPKDSKELLLLKEGEAEIPRKIRDKIKIPREARDKTPEKQSRTTVKDKKRYSDKKGSSESPENNWVKDPRMPHELNELTALMWKSRLKESVKEQYRHPGSDEISETVDFMTYLRPEEKIKKTSRTDRPFRLPTIDESITSIKRLKERYKPVHKQL